MVSLLIFGDSIVFGKGDEEFCGGWVGRLKPVLEKREGYWCVFNLGIPGSERLRDIKKRISREVEARFKKKYGDSKVVILIAAGLNDTLLVDNKPQTLKSKFTREIQQIVKISQKYTKKIAWIGLLPVNEERIGKFFGHPTFKDQFIRDYNLLLRENCANSSIPFLDLFSLLENTTFQAGFLSEDGVHPNQKGYARITKHVINFLKKNRLV